MVLAPCGRVADENVEAPVCGFTDAAGHNEVAALASVLGNFSVTEMISGASFRRAGSSSAAAASAAAGIPKLAARRAIPACSPGR